MRQLIKIMFIFFAASMFTHAANAAVTGGIEYQIPIDYSVMNETELRTKADEYYQKSANMSDRKLNDDITQALNLYTMLSNKCPENTEYIIRLGKLYDIIGKDRHAKSCYYRAIGINKSNPDAYFCFGDFYFKREQYRRALKMFLKSKELGYADDTALQTRIDLLKRMLGEE